MSRGPASWRARRELARRDQRGVVVPLVAVAMVVLLLIAAFVLDLGVARTRSRSIQSAVDLAALAAGPALGRDDPRDACATAVENLRSNVTEFSTLDPTTACSNLPTAACSSPSTVSTATHTSGGSTLRIRYPATDAAIAVAGSTGPWPNDGSACRRMTVELASTQTTAFGGITGNDETSVTRSATVLGRPVTTADVPALWLLDPTGCTALSVTGGSQLTAGAEATGSTPAIPGLIAVDSDGSDCSSNQVTISASGTGSQLTAVPSSGDTPGQVTLFAQPPGSTTCAPPACSSADVTGGRLSPAPANQASRATRAPVDWRFNCRSTYPDYRSTTVEGCPTEAPPYLDNLRTAVGASGQPAGFQRWRATQSCNPSGTVTVTGNWWVDCPSGLSIGNGTTVTFSGGNVVMDQALSMTGGALNFNSTNTTPNLPVSCTPPLVTTPCTTSSSATAAWVYQRAGEWRVTGGVLNVNRAAVIMANGYLQVAGGAPPRWLAPTEGPFSGLAYWSELSSNKFSMAGGAGVMLSGVFFTPNADPFSLTGGGTWGQQSAQFISYRLAVSGGGTATLVPDERLVGRVVEKPGLLIR